MFLEASHYYYYYSRRPPPILLLLLSAALAPLAGADCNFVAYYKTSNDYPNTYYCTGRESTWDGGTIADHGGCMHLGSNSEISYCSCTCAAASLSDGLRNCVNSYDRTTSACYSNTIQCDPCGSGFERRGCGCDGAANNYQCSPGACFPCMNSTFSVGGWNAPCNQCSSCAAGKYETATCFKGTSSMMGADTLCAACPGGYICAGGAAAKAACPASTYCAGGSDLLGRPCRLEASAQYCDATGLSSFTLGCAPGYRYRSGLPIVSDAVAALSGGSTTGSGCVACGLGYALDYLLLPHTQTACVPCAAGSYADGAVSSVCILCPSGTYGDAIAAGTAASCTPCQAGTFASLQGSSVCTRCAAGKYLSAGGAITSNMCIDCAPGNYSAVAGASRCGICPGGTYSGAAGGTACTVCPVGKTTYIIDGAYGSTAPKSGAASAADCRACLDGFRACQCLYDANDNNAAKRCLIANCSLPFDASPDVFLPCVPCAPANDTAPRGLSYCPGGVPTLRKQAALGVSFVVSGGTSGAEVGGGSLLAFLVFSFGVVGRSSSTDGPCTKSRTIPSPIARRAASTPSTPRRPAPSCRIRSASSAAARNGSSRARSSRAPPPPTPF